MSDDGFDVDCAELHGGANILLRIVGRAEEHGMGDAAGGGGMYGHALLYGAVARFCTAINVGVAALRAHAENTAAGLAASGDTYLDVEDATRERVVRADG